MNRLRAVCIINCNEEPLSFRISYKKVELRRTQVFNDKNNGSLSSSSNWFVSLVYSTVIVQSFALLLRSIEIVRSVSTITISDNNRMD